MTIRAMGMAGDLRDGQRDMLFECGSGEVRSSDLLSYEALA